MRVLNLLSFALTLLPGTCPLDPRITHDWTKRYTEPISNLRARVKDGRLILDQTTSLPDGMTLDLVLDDEGDDLIRDLRPR